MAQLPTDGTMVLQVPPTMAGKTVQDLMREVRRAMETGLKRLIVDLKETSFIDSSGIGSLVLAEKELKARGGAVVMRNLSPALRDLFEMTGVDQIFSVETDGGLRESKFEFDAGSVDVRLDIREEEVGDVGILRLSGLMNHPQGSQFFKSRFLLALAQHKKILLDMEELTFIDSVSVGVVISMYKLATETGGGMRVCSANYIVYDLLATLNVDKTISFFDLREQALENWQ
jgi:anti-anti-sigma factor